MVFRSLVGPSQPEGVCNSDSFKKPLYAQQKSRGHALFIFQTYLVLASEFTPVSMNYGIVWG